MLAADHAIADMPALHRRWPWPPRRPPAPAVSSPSACAPPAPETGYGYIERGDPLPDAPGVHAVARFVEKPDAADRRAPGRGRPASVELRHVRVHRPHPAARSWTRTPRTCCRAVRPAVDGAARRPRLHPPGRRRRSPPAPRSAWTMRWPSAPDRAAVVPADIGWSDVGSWSALWELGQQGRGGQRRRGRRAAGERAQLLRPQRRHAGRGGRAGRRRRGGDRGRRAGDASRPRPGREEGGGPAEGRRPARGGRA